MLLMEDLHPQILVAMRNEVGQQEDVFLLDLIKLSGTRKTFGRVNEPNVMSHNCTGKTKQKIIDSNNV